MAEKGIHTVVGMREPITDRDAEQFSRHFYRDVGETVKNLGLNQTQSVPWVATITDARRSFGNNANPDHLHVNGEWTMPIVYSLPDDFELTADSRRINPALDSQRYFELLGKLDQFKEFADEIGLSQRLADEIAATEAELFVDT